ncbi:hypothetical protein [Thalassotalea fusca]
MPATITLKNLFANPKTQVICTALTAWIFSCVSYATEVLPQNQWRAETRVNSAENWRIASPKRFDIVENFFLKHDCSFVMVRAYIYDSKKQHWLTYDEAISAFPEMKEILTTQSCDIPINNEQLTEILQLELPQKPGYIMLYFDFNHSHKDGTWTIFNEGQKKRYLAMRSLAATFNEIPRYLVRTPDIGFKPQKF